MKKTQIADYHQKTREELIARVQELKSELAKAFADLVAGKLKDSSSLKMMRKELARLLTIIREKELLEVTK